MEVYSVVFENGYYDYDCHNRIFSTLDKAVNYVKEYAQTEYGVEPLEIDRCKDISVDFHIADIICAYITKEEVH